MNSTHHIPKAEIHVHLEATITPTLCRKFATRNSISLSNEIFGSKYAYAWTDFYDFIYFLEFWVGCGVVGCFEKLYI